MIRTQIQLPESQHRRLKAVAQQRGISFAELVRRLLDHGLEGEAIDRRGLYEHAAQLVGAFQARDADLSTRHDAHLENTYQ